MRSNRDQPRSRARFACFRVAADCDVPPQPPRVVVRLSPHADSHTARPVAAGRSRTSARSASSIACTRRLEASTVRDDVRAYRRRRGWVASPSHPSGGFRTAAASEDASGCARRASRRHVPCADVGVATQRRAHGAACVPAPRGAAETVGNGAVPASRAGAGAGFALRDHPPKRGSERATTGPPGSPSNDATAQGPGTGHAGAHRATPRRCTRHHVQDQMGLEGRALGVPRDRSGAGRQQGDPRTLAALPVAAAAGARCHARRRRRARNARAPARRCRMATLRRWPPQLVRNAIPSTRNVCSTTRHGDRCLI